MRDFSILKARILQYIESIGVSKYEFYQKTGVSNGILSQKNGLSEENTMRFLSCYTDVNPEWLLTGKGSMLKKEREEKEVALTKSHLPQVVTVNNDQNDNIVLVPIKAAAGYLLGYGDPKFIQELPSYHLPNLQHGTFRMFQVSGHSMYPTLQNGCYVVGEWEEDWIDGIKDNQVYIVVTTDGVLVKRAINRILKYNNLYLKSDNRREYPSVSVEPETILEVWKVKMHLSFELPDPAEIYDRVNDLEARIIYIENRDTNQQ